MEAAQPFGAVQLYAASAGPAKRSARGGIEAPIQARIVYGRQGAYEVRQARITCRLNGAGVVTALR